MRYTVIPISSSGWILTAAPISPFPRAPGTKPSWVSPLAQALLRSADSNVLAVDWVYRSFMYSVLAEEYKEVALHVSALIKELKVRVCTILAQSVLTRLAYLSNHCTLSVCAAYVVPQTSFKGKFHFFSENPC